MAFLSIVGSIVGAIGSLAQASYAAQVANNNAKVATQNAAYAEQAGQEQAAVQSTKGAEVGGEIKTALAANNVDVNTGSAADVEAGAREVSKLDTETVLNNADLTAYGYRTQAVNYEAQAQQDQIGGVFGALGGILGSASGFSKSWSGVF